MSLQAPVHVVLALFVGGIAIQAQVTWCQKGPFQLPADCSLPAGIDKSVRHPIDDHCGITGDAPAKATDSQMQNRLKNNLCVAGSTVDMVRNDFVKMQAKVDKMVADGTFSYGGESKLPDADQRHVIEGEEFFQTANGNPVHEGVVVRFVAYVVEAHAADIARSQKPPAAKTKKSRRYGESVNCHGPRPEDNDIHIALAAASSSAECSSVTAEMIPHFRPDDWDADVINGIGEPVRVTGQLFFDASHKICSGGKPLKGQPARASDWEIHPVYSLEVCKHSRLSDCAANDDTAWQSLAEWQSEGGHEGDSEE